MTLRVELTSAPAADDVVAAMLDLEYILLGENVLNIEDVSDWLEEAHSQVESAWLGCVTEKLHLKYQPEAIV
jgi:uncharacterized protein (TIGR04255 family)